MQCLHGTAGFMRQLVAFEQQLQEGPAVQRRGRDDGDAEESAAAPCSL